MIEWPRRYCGGRRGADGWTSKKIRSRDVLAKLSSIRLWIGEWQHKDESLRVLIVSQYFWPESFRINDLAIGLQNRGHEVTVFTGLPNYPHGKLYPGYDYSSRRNTTRE